MKEPAPKKVIYSARELAEVLDLSALSAPEGTKFKREFAAATLAQVPGTVADVSAYYQKSLSERGWGPVPEPDRKNTDEYAAQLFGKNGHLVSLAVSKHFAPEEKRPQTTVIMEFHGNLDTSTLPSPAGGKPLYPSQISTSHITDSTVAEAQEWATKSLATEGWQRG